MPNSNTLSINLPLPVFFDVIPVYILCIIVDDLEVEFVNSLQTTQQEMMSKLATIETDGVVVQVPNGGILPGVVVGEESGVVDGNSPRPEHGQTTKKKESRKWKNWGWKSNANPAANAPKQSSIEEEAESPKKSASSRHSSPVESPKHKLLGSGAKPGDDSGSNSISPASLRRKKFLTSSKNQSPVNRSEARASAGARLYEELDSLQDSDEELQALIVNGRPATIHLIQPSTIPGLY